MRGRHRACGLTQALEPCALRSVAMRTLRSLLVPIKNQRVPIDLTQTLSVEEAANSQAGRPACSSPVSNRNLSSGLFSGSLAANRRDEN